MNPAKMITMEMNMASRMRRCYLVVVLGALALFGVGRNTVPAQSATAVNPGQAVRSLIMTTDCGADMDDQWALAHLALSPEFHVRGVITTHAPGLASPAAETAARNARDVLDHLPLLIRPPVLAGSSVPLSDKAVPLQNAGVYFILGESRSFTSSNRLTVLVTGAATDVASALLVDPTLGDRIQIVAMGFNKWPEGTDPFNVKNDIKAWQVLLESRAPIVVGDTTVTDRHLRMTRERAKELFDSHGDAGKYLAGLLVSWLDQHADLVQSVTGDRDSWPVWDEVTVAYLLGFTTSEEHPRPRMRDDMVFEHPAGGTGGPAITWITSIDSAKLWSDFTGKLDRALAASGLTSANGT